MELQQFLYSQDICHHGKRRTLEDSPLVVGHICYHQNLLLLSSHVSHGCDGGFPSSAGLCVWVLVLDALLLPTQTRPGGQIDPVWLADRQIRTELLVALWSGSHRRPGISTGGGGWRKERVCERRGGGILLWDPGTTSRNRAEEVFQGMWLVIMEWVACRSAMCLCKRRDDRLREGERHNMGEAGGRNDEGAKI